MIGPLEKRLLVSGVISTWLVLLCAWVLGQFLDAEPSPPDLSAFASLGSRMIRAKQIEEAFAPQNAPRLKPVRNVSNPFYPSQIIQPPPPPPVEKGVQVQMLYQGLYQTSSGDVKAFIQLPDKLIVGTNGAPLVHGLTIAEISPKTLILRDTKGKTFNLEFNIQKTLEISSP